MSTAFDGGFINLCVTTKEEIRCLFLDWVLSKKGQTFISQDLGITPVRLDVEVPEGMVPLDELRVMPSNHRDIYLNKDDILGNFTEIFGLE